MHTKKNTFIKYLITVLLIVFIFSSCSPEQNHDISAGKTFIKAFDPAEFLKDGITKYFDSSESLNPKFTETFIPSFTNTRSTSSNGTLNLTAKYTDFDYGNFSISGDFQYSLPIVDGNIQGYRVNSTNTQVTDNESGDTNTLSVNMPDSSVLAPAFGTVSIEGDSVSISNGYASTLLPNSDVTFTVENNGVSESIELSVIENEIDASSFTKDDLPDDIYNLYLSSGLIRTIIFETIELDENSSPINLFETENTIEITYQNGFPYYSVLTITEPMNFTHTTGNGNKFYVYTSGKLKEEAYYQNNGTAVYEDFSTSVTIIENGSDPITYTSKICNGTYGASLAGGGSSSGSISVGGHTYSGNELFDLDALSFINQMTRMWGLYNTWQTPDENGNTKLNIPSPYFSSSAVYKKGNSSSTLTGEFSILSHSYDFVFEFTETTDGLVENVENFSFDGHQFSEEALSRLDDCYEFTRLLI